MIFPVVGVPIHAAWI